MAIKLSTDTDVTTAIAGIVGFTPRESVVSLMLTTSGQLVLSSRQDIDGADHDGVGRVAATQDSAAAYVVIVSEDQSPAAAAEIAADVTSAYAAHGITVTRRLHAPVIRYGAQWTNLDTKETGLINDPEHSTAGLESRLKGGNPAADRAQVAADIDRTTAEYTSDDYARITAGRALDDLAVMIDSGAPRDLDPGELAKSLATYSVMGGYRDEILRQALSRPADTAQALIELARHLRGTDRAHLLTPAAAAAYLDGNGGKANIILAAARNAARTGETPTMTRLLQQALNNGIPPKAIAELIAKGL